MSSWIDKKELVKYLKTQFILDWNGWHGARHWARVHRNSILLAKAHDESGIEADYDVLKLFSLLHDHKRQDEGYDIEHGKRAADELQNLRGRYFDLSDAAFNELWTACAYHSDGFTEHPSVNVRICWDADRLDLYRVGVIPNPKYLCTDPAKDQSFIDAAVKRSLRNSN